MDKKLLPFLSICGRNKLFLTEPDMLIKKTIKKFNARFLCPNFYSTEYILTYHLLLCSLKYGRYMTVNKLGNYY
jgi:hypothetical protein